MGDYAWWWMNLTPLLLWIGMMLAVASRPKTALLPRDTKVIYGFPRKVIPYLYHVSAFFVLAVLFRRCFSSRSNRPGSHKREILSLFGCTLVSVCSEITQFYVPTRTPAVRDLAFDLFGATLAIFLMPRIWSAISGQRTGLNTRD